MSLSSNVILGLGPPMALVFGGCCSNALALEQLTAAHPGTGTLLTFTQFAVVALCALPGQLVADRSGAWKLLPRMRQRQVPLAPYALQVALFFTLSRLNNAAFAYEVPMPVHIIFRSGGLIISLVLGRLILGRKYTTAQVFSVLSVTAGVLLTTLSASDPSPPTSTSRNAPASTYVNGIALLAIALVLSGILGIIQDRTFAAHRRDGQPAPWKEAMFYLHALALPLFLPSASALRSQLSAIASSRRISIALPSAIASLIASLSSDVKPTNHISVPSGFIPLVLNLITQLACSAGVNALTGSLTAPSVALVLATRKAVSLVLSAAVFGASTVRRPVEMGAGAVLVFIGSVGWAWASTQASEAVKKKEKDE